MYLDNYKTQLTELCKIYNVKHLFAFGSVLTDNFNEKSDIDFLVDIISKDPFSYAENYFDLKFAIQDLLKRRIDLLEEKALKNSYLKIRINQSKVKLYEA